MDERARRIEARKRRSLSRNFALARRIGRRPWLVQKFRRTRSVHRTVAKAPRSRSPSGSRRFAGRTAILITRFDFEGAYSHEEQGPQITFAFWLIKSPSLLAVMDCREAANDDFGENKMDKKRSELVAKVPQVTLLFWIIKILATTLGETGGDAVTMSWLGETTAAAKGTGYLMGTAIFGVIFVAAVLVQIRAKKFHPFLYWLTIVATTTVGTTLADYCTRSLGIGYTGGSTILLVLVIASLLIWRWSTGSLSIEDGSLSAVMPHPWRSCW